MTYCWQRFQLDLAVFLLHFITESGEEARNTLLSRGGIAVRFGVISRPLA